MTRADEQAIRARAQAGTTQHCDTEILRADVRTLLEALDAIRAALQIPGAGVEGICAHISDQEYERKEEMKTLEERFQDER